MGLFAALKLTGVGFKLARAGLFGLVDPSDLPGAAQRAVALARMLEPRGLTKTEQGQRLSLQLIALGPSYIKLGQLLSTRSDLIGVEVAEALAHLKDELPPFPTEQAKQIITAQLGAPVDSVFTEISEPLAAASVAQVHFAKLAKTGEEVAVKVLRPNIRQRFAADLDTYDFAARLIERFVPSSKRLKPTAVVDILRRSMLLELDLRMEAAALSELANNTAEDSGFSVPEVDWDHIGRDMLTTAWISGEKLSQLTEQNTGANQLKSLAVTIVQSFLRQAVRDGFFHADMHEGNLFYDRTTNELIAVDCGIMGRIGHKERRFLAEILYGFIRRDYQRIAEVHFEAGYVPARHSVADFAMALRAIGEPIHGRDARDISMGKLLGLLFEVTDAFDMQTRPELILLQKTMVVVEGVARRLDPQFDMWDAAEPVVRSWLESELGVAAKVKTAIDGFAALSEIASDLPQYAEQLHVLSANLTAMSEHGLKFDAETAQAIGKSEAYHSRSGRWALWVGALALVLIAWTVARW